MCEDDQVLIARAQSFDSTDGSAPRRARSRALIGRRGGTVLSVSGDPAMRSEQMTDLPATPATTEIVTKTGPLSVAATVARLTGMIEAKGMRLFAVIDQRDEARGAGLDLRDTVLVVFGSPAAGTPVMQASPLSALDLPLKALVWDDAGTTKVSYYAPAALAARHHLPDELAANLAGINALTDVLVAGPSDGAE
jgi:uncharacterized protein (DUF302 family)